MAADKISETDAGVAKRRDDTNRTERIRIEQHGFAGLLWFAGWLFTIGYLQLPLVKGILALLLWPYYLGVHFGPET